MFGPHVYWLILALCVWIGSVRGSRDARHVILTIAVGSLASAIALPSAAHNYRQFELGLLVVDVCVLLSFLACSLTSSRYWPLWVTSMQVVSVAVQLATLVSPGVVPDAYSLATTFWVYPMLVVTLAFGTRRTLSMTRLRTS